MAISPPTNVPYRRYRRSKNALLIGLWHGRHRAADLARMSAKDDWHLLGRPRGMVESFGQLRKYAPGLSRSWRLPLGAKEESARCGIRCIGGAHSAGLSLPSTRRAYRSATGPDNCGR